MGRVMTLDSMRRRFNGSMGEIINTAHWLDGIAISNDLPADTVFALQVCAEEILTNIVRHCGSSGPQIEIDVRVDPHHVELVIVDDGEAFDVASAPARTAQGDLATMQPGGLGIKLIQSFASSLRYERVPQGNQLHVTIDIDRQSVAGAAHT
jgi:anti-sigma regulatory factor (Ser/Thr protein kinase)